MKSLFLSGDLASRSKKAGGEFLGEEQTASEILNKELGRWHQGRGTAPGGAEHTSRQVRSVLSPARGTGVPRMSLSATPQPPLSCPLAPGAACQTQSFPLCLGNGRESISRTHLSVFVYLFIHQGGEEVGSQPF